MEAELTRHFMNNVHMAEEPDMTTQGAVPPPYHVTAPPSYHATSSAPASLSSPPGPAPSSPGVAPSSAPTPAAQVNTIPGVLDAQEESVHVLQQKLKEVHIERTHIWQSVLCSRDFPSDTPHSISGSEVG